MKRMTTATPLWGLNLPGSPNNPKPVPDSRHGYCLKSHELPSAPKICWVRPGTQRDYCLTSLQLPGNDKTLKEREYALPRVKADPTGRGRSVRWRIVTCLNPPSPQPTPKEYKQPCSLIGSLNKQSSAGPILP